MAKKHNNPPPPPRKTNLRNWQDQLAHLQKSPHTPPAAKAVLPNPEAGESVPDALYPKIAVLDEAIGTLQGLIDEAQLERGRQDQVAITLEQQKRDCDEREGELVARERAIILREAEAENGFVAQQRKALEGLKAEIGRLQGERDAVIAGTEQEEREARERIDKARADWLNEQQQARKALADEREELSNEKTRLERGRQGLALAQANQKALEDQIRRELEEEKRREIVELSRRIERLTRQAGEDAGELQRQRDALAAYEDLNRLLERNGLDDPRHLLKEYKRLAEENRRLREAERARPTGDLEADLEALRYRCDEYEQQLAGRDQQIGQLRTELATSRVSVLEKQTLAQERRVLEAHKTALDSAVNDLERRLNELTDRQQGSETFPDLSAMDRDLTSIGATDQVPDLASFAREVRARIVNATPTPLYYTEQVIRLFMGGLAMSQLHILQGISGTGKTSLPIAFAKAVGGHCTVVPVQAGWRDRDDLFGHYNAFERRFYERDSLKAIYRAGTPTWTDRINIVLLDEMNLSHPEQYFADVLSALERPQGEREIMRAGTAHGKPPVLLCDGRPLIIPPNLWFVGTANQDETTKGFADKTIDRAHLMELPRSEAAFTPEPTPERLAFSVASLYKQFDKAVKQHRRQVEEVLKAIYQSQFSTVLAQQFDLGWGNRLERQALRFVPVVIAAGGSRGEAFDHLLATRLFRPGKVTERYDVGIDELRDLERELTALWKRVDPNNDLPLACMERLEREIKRKEQQG